MYVLFIFIFNYLTKWKKWQHNFLFIFNRKSNYKTNNILDLANLTPYICLQFFSYLKNGHKFKKNSFNVYI